MRLKLGDMRTRKDKITWVVNNEIRNIRKFYRH